MYEHLGIDNKNQSYRCLIFFASERKTNYFFGRSKKKSYLCTVLN